MLRRLAIGLMAVVLMLSLAASALADHNGPYCQAEDRSDGRVTFETENHDYCGD